VDEKSFKAQGNLIVTPNGTYIPVEHISRFKVDTEDRAEEWGISYELLSDHNARDFRYDVGIPDSFLKAYEQAYKYAKTLDTLMLLQASCPGECQDEDE
jgi:hypothetical protein